MGNITSLYLSDEAKAILDERLKKDPTFNVSRFVVSCLMNERQKIRSPAEIQLEIENKKANITTLKNEVDFLEDMHRRVSLEIETKLKEEQEEKIRLAKKHYDKIKSFADTFMTFYEIDLSKAIELAEEFAPIRDDKGWTVFQFMDGRGYKEKPKEIIK